MFALLINQLNGLPTIVSMRSNVYPELVQMGYTEIRRGYRKDLEDDEREIMESMVQELEFNDCN